MERLLVLAAETAYQTDDFLAAAREMGVEVIVGNDRCHVLADVWRDALAHGPWPLDFRDAEAAAATIVRRATTEPIAGIIATDETTAVIAARAADRLGLAHNPITAAQTARNKLAFRRALTAAGLPQPAFTSLPTGSVDREVVAACTRIGFPLVVKPQHLSASRGVMRADEPRTAVACFRRLAALLATPAVRGPDPEAAGTIVLEQFVGGAEVSFEGLLRRGQLHCVALFDKPDPLDGPFFAETIYVTPSRHPAALQDAVFEAVAAAAAAIGLVEGPVHAELRLSAGGPLVLELAARSIGGLCSRTLRYGAGISLEQLVIAHALGRDPVPVRATSTASGVMMLPVPSEGVIVDIDNVDAARHLPDVRDVVITARIGDTVAPLPEGNTYLGFVFATAEDAERVIASLRAAEAALVVRIAPRL